MGKKEKKTNAMRILDKAGIAYRVLQYEADENNFDGTLVAEQVGLDPGEVFKTLVTLGDGGRTVVCCIPVDRKLDLRALASAVGVKRLEMLAVQDILRVTGYVRGGCSPVGMKKEYETWLDQSAKKHKKIAVSAGVRGQQILIAPDDLIACTKAGTGDFCMGGGQGETGDSPGDLE